MVLMVPHIVGALSCSDIKHSLALGSSGAEVSALQQFLINEDLLSDTASTGFFGKITQKAVRQWQIQNNIVASSSVVASGYGMVGPKTRTAIVNQCVNQQQLYSAGTTRILHADSTAGKVPFTVIFSLNAAAGTVSTQNYSIEFGDGEIGTLQATSSVQHTFTAPGLFTVRLSGCDPKMDLFCRDVTVDTLPIRVTGIAKTGGTVNLTATPQKGTSIRLVRFVFTDTVIRSDPDGTYSLDFGDNTNILLHPLCTDGVCSAQVDHVYSSGGNFNTVVTWKLSSPGSINDTLIQKLVKVIGESGQLRS